MSQKPDPDREQRRFDREFDRFAGLVPMLRGTIKRLRSRRLWLIRIPIGFAFILGGLLAFLPVLGIWMLPVGILLLAVDIAPLRPYVARATILARRRFLPWWNRLKARFRSKND